MLKHILIHNDKSTHILLISMYFQIIQFYSTISAFINIYMVITEWIISKYINIHSDISIFIISFHMYHCYLLANIYTLQL